MASLKNIGQRLLDSTTLDDRLLNYLRQPRQSQPTALQNRYRPDNTQLKSFISKANNVKVPARFIGSATPAAPITNLLPNNIGISSAQAQKAAMGLFQGFNRFGPQVGVEIINQGLKQPENNSWSKTPITTWDKYKGQQLDYYRPTGKLEQTLFGKEKIAPLGRDIKSLQDKMEARGVDTKYAKPISIGAGGTYLAANFITGGRGGGVMAVLRSGKTPAVMAKLIKADPVLLKEANVMIKNAPKEIRTVEDFVGRYNFGKTLNNAKKIKETERYLKELKDTADLKKKFPDGIDVGKGRGLLEEDGWRMESARNGVETWVRDTKKAWGDTLVAGAKNTVKAIREDSSGKINPNAKVGLPGRETVREVKRLRVNPDESYTEIISQKGAKTISGNAKPPGNISLWKKSYNRITNTIAKEGGVPGQKLSAGLKQVRDIAEPQAARWIEKMPTVKKLSHSEFENFVDAAEGNAKAMSPKIAQAVKEWARVRPEVLAVARKAGVDAGRLEDYFPHTYDQNMFKNVSKYNQAIKHLIETGQAKTEAEAIKILGNMNNVMRKRVNSNLELQRKVNLPGYDKTKSALYNYLNGASDRIAQVKVFGQADEKAMKLIAQIEKQGGDAQSIKEMYDIASGARKYDQGFMGLSKNIRKVNTITKLGLGAFTNAGQSTNTATVTGFFNTMRAMGKVALNAKDRAFVRQTGVILDSVLQDVRAGAGYSGDKLATIAAPGFNAVEKWNRTVAAVAGRDYARARAAAGDAKTLKKMGIILKGKKLTAEQEVQAARNMVERTQFKVDAMDLPGWASSPGGKILAQFRTFSYNQSAFMAREIIQPAIHGDIQPLVRFLAIGIPVGVGVQTTKNVIRNRKDEENPIKRIYQGFNQVGGSGLVGDVFNGLVPMNRNYLSSDRAISMAVGTLGGPTAGTVAEGYGATVNLLQGRPVPMERFILKQIPVVGGTLQNTFVPYQKNTGEKNVRFDIAGALNGTSNGGVPESTTSVGTKVAGTNYVAEAEIDAKIKELNAQEKKILEDNGIGLFRWRMGGLTDDQKNQEIAKLEAEKANLEFQKKVGTAKYDYDAEKANYSLDSDRLKRNEDFRGWYLRSASYVQELAAYQATLDPTIDAIEITRIQNSIEDKLNEMAKYAGYGGFKKGSGSSYKKISLPKTSARKVVSISSSSSSRSNPPSVKIIKQPAYQTSKTSANTYVTSDFRPKTYTIKFSKKPSLTGF